LNNKIIKNQLYKIPCSLLSNLYLKVQCVPFNNIPFNFSLVNHNPPIADLLDCIDSSERTHELFARLIKNNTEQRGILYTSKADIVGFKNPEELAEKYNNVLYHRHQYARIEIFKNHFYIKEYDENVYEIIYKLKKYAESGIKNYTHSVDLWMKNSGLIIDCDEKKNALRNLFKNSKVAFIYGAAGTGKSTMINYISSLFKDKQKIFLANTNPAVENLRRKVTAEHAEFVTITKFLSKDVSNDCDILCLDECSTISNRDMVRVLQRAQCKLLVLVGDIYQIESILFGNWFNIAYKVMPKDSVAELTRPHRTTVQGLIEVWNKVREITEDRLEFITRNGLSSTLDESIFSRTEEDEIVLCLNYDGIYGINNINKFLQSNNVNPSINWGVLSYKVGDPVLFNESNRFAPLVYNNLKGKILQIEEEEDCIYFTIEVYTVLNELDVIGFDLELKESVTDETSVIRFKVGRGGDGNDDNDNVENVVPFQVAYAISIHKAQGLEYESVKVVITSEIEEMVSHNIFYTAITRAKSKLKIYWSPETEKRILENMKVQFNDKDYQLFKAKYKEALLKS